MSSSRRVYKQLQEQQKRLLAQLTELANLEEGGGGDEAFFMEEDKDDHHRRQRASHSCRVIEVVGQIAKPRRAANLDRKRERRGKDLLEDNFIPNNIFPDHVFRRRFRMQRNFFDKIMSAICNHDPYSVKKEDAFHVLGLNPEQKITAALRMLAYGASTDQVDEIARMGITTVMESLMWFCSAIEALYTNEYLRTSTPRDILRLLRKGEIRGFPGMIRSIDCMHWTWKNCPMFDKLLQGKSPRCTYWVNGTQYEGSYYLADGIYSRWSTFVKTVPHPQTKKEKHFAKCQEGCRKDVERCFGILQARWAIVRATARMFDVEALRSIMMTCIILHNMIVEDEYDYDAVDEYEPDSINNSRTRIYYAHDRTEDPVQHKPLERDGRYNELIVQQYTDVQEPYWHVTYQNDLIEHQWGLHKGEDN
ncbi:uncharacterized protein [Malus domestica]|uniref:uncharacterized protein n=1 Tax=Malus domestica TaxID=3750 RepID=UPI003974DE9E